MKNWPYRKKSSPSCEIVAWVTETDWRERHAPAIKLQSNSEGVLINSVKPESPAAFVGLRPGMLILEANQETVKKVSELSRALESSLETKKVLLLVRDRRAARYVSFSLD